MTVDVMNNRDVIISEIANLISDFKYLPNFEEGDAHENIKSHVERWGRQFNDDMDFVLIHTRNLLKDRYFKASDYDKVLNDVASNAKNHRHFRNDCLLNIQERGGSQSDLISLFNQKINNNIGITMPVISSSDDLSSIDYTGFNYITYMDDFSFSAKLAGDDIIRFINDSEIDNAKIRVVLFLVHSYGMYQLENRLNAYVEEHDLNIEFIFNKHFWGVVNNSIAHGYSCNSSVYFPESGLAAEILDSCNYTGSELYTPRVFRVGSHSDCILGNDQDRRRIEGIFSSKGFDIINSCIEVSRSLKPLGFSSFPGLGFGGNVFSYRNCPNNVPLVFWWGSYSESGNPALDCWYPLMKREVYTHD